MDMAHLHKKMKKGRPYYYVREIARVDGKPKVINQIYLGSPERILEMAQGGNSMPKKIQAQAFGALWLANLVEKEIDLAGLIDGIVAEEKDNAPSVGEYFLYAVYNRMIQACSKRAMPGWYKATAIQHIRPVQIDELNSQMFWFKWNQVGERQLQQIAKDFLRRISRIESSSSDCFMFDTTNYYTFMATDTESVLAQRGKSKEGRNWLRQIGVALLVSRDKRIPLYYREYEGNRHDSKMFLQTMEDMFRVMRDSAGEDGALTVVFDKGMNSEDNIAAIDAREGVNFITTYSTHYADHLVHVDLDRFKPVDTRKNRKLAQKGREDDRLLAWRTQGEYWGRKRTVVVTYNPLTAAKQRYAFEKKMLRLQDTLFEFQSRVNRQAPYWRKQSVVLKRYMDICSELHIPSDLYKVEFYVTDKRLRMNFRKNHYRIGRYIDRFGKNIIITNITDWSTDEIVQASLDRWTVEDAFRLTKDESQVALRPVRHWTDSKIRCHIFTCIAALALLRIIELRLRKAGVNMTAKAAMRHMGNLHSCLLWLPGKRKAVRMLEEPDEAQADIMRAFGWKIAGGVLQEI
ncbi:transposase [Desulfolithobacter dissulfuricans]|uniref:Transposase n=2 Tax=Desulfolithobacter dissulfuricans TaxID=2795293 RepID=A0A915TZY9_9BACT|nr:transposase [Desulfolithobacter dissulfuricans]BCO09470.1 transposase [Desulfolithobacter dissulfuricans]BCO10430.1 transposase [Desulfolithobacter dissulfuricans]